MNSLNINEKKIDSINIGEYVLLTTDLIEDKCLVAIEDGVIAFISTETCKPVYFLRLNGINDIKSYGNVLKLEVNNGYKLLVGNTDTTSSVITDTYANYSDVYCKDNAIIIAEYNFENALRTTLKVNYAIDTNRAKSGDLNISYNDESIRILGKYKYFYIINFYNDDKNYIVNESDFRITTIESVSDNFIKMLIVDNKMYAFTDSINGDSYIYKIDFTTVVNHTENYIEDDAYNNSINNYLIYFDDKIITYDSRGNFIVFDKDLNKVFYNYDAVRNLALVNVLVINGKLWLINNKGEVIIRNKYNDINQDIAKTLINTGGTNFTNIKTIDKSELNFI